MSTERSAKGTSDRATPVPHVADGLLEFEVTHPDGNVLCFDQPLP